MIDKSNPTTQTFIREIIDYDNLDTVLLSGLKTLITNYSVSYNEGKEISIDNLDSLWQGINELEIHLLNKRLLLDEITKEITAMSKDCL